jgi:hypothetical protein
MRINAVKYFIFEECMSKVFLNDPSSNTKPTIPAIVRKNATMPSVEVSLVLDLDKKPVPPEEVDTIAPGCNTIK